MALSLAAGGGGLGAQAPERLPAHREDPPDRDAWQRPAAVMDALGIKPGSRVADIGAGTGYFSFHLARRVGPNGRVYAEDIAAAALAGLGKRASAEGLPQITTVIGAADDPRLPPGALDAILVVNTYHEIAEADRMMQAFRRALKPGGRLAIIDAEALPGEPPEIAVQHHRISSAIVREDAERNGFRYLRTEAGFINPNLAWYSSIPAAEPWFFLVFRPAVR